MYYWNNDNFEGLKSVGEKYSSITGYELFGDYCLKKEQGLKKLAIASAQEFVAITKIRPTKEQRDIAVELSSLAFWNRQIHQLLPHPIGAFLKDVLTDWVEGQPSDAIPYKWLGYISRDITLYEKALEIDPKDEVCITQIAQSHLSDVDYQTHHLSESLFIGDLEEAKTSLRIAASLIESLASQSLKSVMQEELEYYKRVIVAWEEFSIQGLVEPFPKWCAAKGESFNFLSIVYYDR